MPLTRSHEENQKVVCFTCFKKAQCELTEFVKQKALEVLKKYRF